jgi:hypothetical protein
LPDFAGFGTANSLVWPALAGFCRVLQILPVAWLPSQTGAKTIKHAKTQKNTDFIFVCRQPAAPRGIVLGISKPANAPCSQAGLNLVKSGQNSFSPTLSISTKAVVFHVEMALKIYPKMTAQNSFRRR